MRRRGQCGGGLIGVGGSWLFAGVAEWLSGVHWMVVVVGGGRVVGLRCGESRRFLEACRGHVVVGIVDTWEVEADGDGVGSWELVVDGLLGAAGAWW